MRQLTDRQKLVLATVMAHIEQHGCPPSIRDLRVILKIGSVRGVTAHLDSLVRKGFIETQFGVTRGIRVLRDAEGRRVALKHIFTEGFNNEQ